jgi:hypothetical protein
MFTCRLAHEIVRVIALIGTEADAVKARNLFGHQQGGIAFGAAVGLRVETISRLVIIDTAEALLSRPCFQQGSIYREMLIGEQVALPPLRQNRLKEGFGDVAIQ